MRSWLLLLAYMSLTAVRGAIDPELVAQAASAGMSTGDIALQLGCTQRRVQQILAFLKPALNAGCLPPQPQPAGPDALLDMVRQEIQRHGDYYGVQMLLGALRQWHPEHYFSRRAVAAAAATLRPEAYRARRCEETRENSPFLKPTRATMLSFSLIRRLPVHPASHTFRDPRIPPTLLLRPIWRAGNGQLHVSSVAIIMQTTFATRGTWIWTAKWRPTESILALSSMATAGWCYTPPCFPTKPRVACTKNSSGLLLTRGDSLTSLTQIKAKNGGSAYLCAFSFGGRLGARHQPVGCHTKSSRQPPMCVPLHSTQFSSRKKERVNLAT